MNLSSFSTIASTKALWQLHLQIIPPLSKSVVLDSSATLNFM